MNAPHPMANMLATMTTNQILAALGWTKRPAGDAFNQHDYHIINATGEIVHTGDALSTSRYLATVTDKVNP